MQLMDFLESLPPIPLFLTTLGMGAVAATVILVLVRAISRSLGVKSTDVIAIRDSLITSLSALFAITVAFASAGIWNDFVQARAAIQREANALENAFELSAGLPGGMRQEVQSEIVGVGHRILEHDWPVMMHVVKVDQVLNEPSSVVRLIARLSTRNPQGGLEPQANLLIGQLYDLRSARIQREIIARGGLSEAQWTALLAIASAALVLIALSYNHDLGLRITTASIYTVAISSALYLVVAHQTPFAGYLAVQPTPIEQALKRMQEELSKSKASDGTPVARSGSEGGAR